MKRVIKRTILGVSLGIGVMIILTAAFFGILTIAEYRPPEIGNLEIEYHDGGSLARVVPGVPFSVLSWNIGYACLDETQDFFMDGGKIVRPSSDKDVQRNLAGIREIIRGADCDVVLLQETDIASKRSYYINQRAYLTETFQGTSAFAYNFNAVFVPIPFPEFIGRVESGLLTLSRFESSSAQRLRLPNPFSWPTRVANLKRCLLVSRIPLEGPSGAELVIVNLHLEAYETSGGREAQTRVLIDFLNQEYAKGNYCIAGGDFNQNFPGIDPVRYAIKKSDYFVPGTLSASLLDEGWQFAFDRLTPSCRLLNEPFSGENENTQLYIIDGFILSPNVRLLGTETLDLGFKYSDHNPVKMRVVLE